MLHGAGKLVRAESVTDGITTTFHYDDLARVSDVETFLDNDTYKVSTRYDSRQRPEQLAYPSEGSGSSRFTVDYTYDRVGALSMVQTSAGSFWSVHQRDPDGRITQVKQESYAGDTINRHFYFDPNTRDLRTQDIEAVHRGKVLESKEYHYHPSGLLKQATSYLDSNGGLVLQDDETYTYDYAARLASWTSKAGTSNYTYSADGDLKTAISYGSSGTQEAYTYAQTNNAGPHAPTALGNVLPKVSFNYDKAGRLTQKVQGGIAIFATKYTDQNLPYEITQTANNGVKTTTKFRYDAFGNRVMKSAPGFESLTIGKGYERQKVTANNLAKTTHAYRIFAGDSLIAQETYEEGGPVERTFINTDHLGSSSLVVKSNGTVKQALKYDPWGKRLGTLPDPKSPYRIGYTGHEHDDELGLINMGGRIYDPSLRFVLTPDPMASGATNEGIHPYLYVMGNPVNATDPSGFSSCTLGEDTRIHCGEGGRSSGGGAGSGGGGVGSSGGGGTSAGGGAGGSAGSGTSDQTTTNPTGGGQAHASAPGSPGGAGSGGGAEGSRDAATAAAAAAGPHPGGGGGVGDSGLGGGSITGALGLSLSTGVSDDRRTSGTGITASQLAHAGLGLASLAPGGGGLLFAAANAALYVYEGDYSTAATQVAVGLAAVVGTGALVWAGGRAWAAFKAWKVARGAQQLVAPGGRKLAQQLARFRGTGGTGGPTEFLEHVNALAGRARESGNMVRGTVGTGPQAIVNGTIYREGSTYIVTDAAGVVRSYVPNAQPGGIVDEFVRLGGRL
jgi:RHS repeat-associated protein